jgi:hypothetical protein
MQKDDANLNPHDDLFKIQNNVSPAHRRQFVESLAERATRLKIRSKGFFLAIKLLDRVLAASTLNTNDDFVLSGIACLSLALKMESRCYPQMKEYVELWDGAFKEEEIIKKESSIMTLLDYRINTTTTALFLNKMLNDLQADVILAKTALFIGLSSLLSPELAIMNCELVAVAVMAVAVKAAPGIWRLGKISDALNRFRAEDVTNCAEKVIECVNDVIGNRHSGLGLLFDSERGGHIVTKLIFKVPETLD